MGLLPNLTSLNLSDSFFAGQIPSTIFQLSCLTILDLNFNKELILKNLDWRSLAHNLTKLEDLRLGYVNISSTVPSIMANLSSMRSLYLSYSGLYGEFPVGIFHLPNLQILTVKGNSNLKGHLPEFNSTSPIQTLVLKETSFSGKLPESIGNLASLKSLDISHCRFVGDLPASIGNAAELTGMDLRLNNFQIKNSSSLSWIGKLTQLQFFGLSGVNFNNEFPPFFSNLTQLTALALQDCQINDEIPSWLTNMTQLVKFFVPSNQLQGLIPDSVFQLKNLELLSLSDNDLRGTVELTTFLSKFQKLNTLGLSDNNLSLLDSVDSNVTTGKFIELGFGSCNLSHFPHFLRHQDQLQTLDLKNNRIHGQIPQWLWNSSRSLESVDLSNNFLTGFEQDPHFLPWTRLIVVDVSNNMLKGSLPIPLSISLEAYLMTNNNLSGEIPSIICNLNALVALDLSYNNFTGRLPLCFGNFSTSIQFLDLEGNHFYGKFPDNLVEECNIRSFNLDSNEIEGKVPRSLANCTKLETLILGSNKIYDVFPSWLGALKELKILILRSNKFYGKIENQETNFGFPKLCIFDVSRNNFSGKLPTHYFLNWNAMKMVEADQLLYMEKSFDYFRFSYTMTLVTKGTKLEYFKILKSLVAIDLSSNKFEGDIPPVIGNLKGLHLLNLSNNNLNGPIPHGKQFDTFENSSYFYNLDLCGNPLPKKCPKALPPSSREEDEDRGSHFEFDWKPVALGYGSGLIPGAIIGHVVLTRKYEWFLKTFRIRNASSQGLQGTNLRFSRE